VSISATTRVALPTGVPPGAHLGCLLVVRRGCGCYTGLAVPLVASLCQVTGGVGPSLQEEGLQPVEVCIGLLACCVAGVVDNGLCNHQQWCIKHSVLEWLLMLLMLLCPVVTGVMPNPC